MLLFSSALPFETTHQTMDLRKAPPLQQCQNESEESRSTNSELRSILIFTFLIGNSLTLVPRSIAKSRPWVFKSLATSVLVAFVFAFTASLMLHRNKRRVADLLRYASMGFTATMVGLLCWVALSLALQRI